MRSTHPHRLHQCTSCVALKNTPTAPRKPLDLDAMCAQARARVWVQIQVSAMGHLLAMQVRNHIAPLVRELASKGFTSGGIVGAAVSGGAAGAETIMPHGVSHFGGALPQEDR